MELKIFWNFQENLRIVRRETHRFGCELGIEMLEISLSVQLGSIWWGNLLAFQLLPVDRFEEWMATDVGEA